MKIEILYLVTRQAAWRLTVRKLLICFLELFPYVKELKKLAYKDFLIPELYNRRGFFELIIPVLSKMDGECGITKRRESTPKVLSIISIDLDEFKPVNDTYGHKTGDMFLQEFGVLLRKSAAIRKDDIVARIGGDEFVIAMISANTNTANRAVKVIKKDLSAHPFVMGDGKKLPFQASFGVVSTEEWLYDLDKLLNEADEQMYKDKVRGRTERR